MKRKKIVIFFFFCLSTFSYLLRLSNRSNHVRNQLGFLLDLVLIQIDFLSKSRLYLHPLFQNKPYLTQLLVDALLRLCMAPASPPEESLAHFVLQPLFLEQKELCQPFDSLILLYLFIVQELVFLYLHLQLFDLGFELLLYLLLLLLWLNRRFSALVETVIQTLVLLALAPLVGTLRSGGIRGVLRQLLRLLRLRLWLIWL